MNTDEGIILVRTLTINQPRRTAMTYEGMW